MIETIITLLAICTQFTYGSRRLLQITYSDASILSNLPGPAILSNGKPAIPGQGIQPPLPDPLLNGEAALPDYGEAIEQPSGAYETVESAVIDNGQAIEQPSGTYEAVEPAVNEGQAIEQPFGAYEAVEPIIPDIGQGIPPQLPVPLLPVIPDIGQGIPQQEIQQQEVQQEIQQQEIQQTIDQEVQQGIQPSDTTTTTTTYRPMAPTLAVRLLPALPDNGQGIEQPPGAYEAVEPAVNEGQAIEQPSGAWVAPTLPVRLLPVIPDIGQGIQQEIQQQEVQQEIQQQDASTRSGIPQQSPVNDQEIPNNVNSGAGGSTNGNQATVMYLKCYGDPLADLSNCVYV